jgi:hypothetical protein
MIPGRTRVHPCRPASIPSFQGDQLRRIRLRGIRAGKQCRLYQGSPVCRASHAVVAFYLCRQPGELRKSSKPSDTRVPTILFLLLQDMLDHFPLLPSTGPSLCFHKLGN